MLVKNVQFVNGLLAFPWVFPYESARFVYVLFFDKGLKAFLDAGQLVPTMLKKRSETRAKSKRTATKIRRWFI
jgi:hypothetical protein